MFDIINTLNKENCISYINFTPTNEIDIERFIVNNFINKDLETTLIFTPVGIYDEKLNIITMFTSKGMDIFSKLYKILDESRAINIIVIHFQQLHRNNMYDNMKNMQFVNKIIKSNLLKKCRVIIVSQSDRNIVLEPYFNVVSKFRFAAKIKLNFSIHGLKVDIYSSYNNAVTDISEFKILREKMCIVNIIDKDEKYGW